MRRRRSTTVVWPERDDAREARVEEECWRLVSRLAAMGAERIVAFGSRARGQAHARSDLDLLVIMAGVRTPFATRLADLYALLRPRVALDLLVYAPEELQAIKNRPFIREALSQGKVLHAA